MTTPSCQALSPAVNYQVMEKSKLENELAKCHDKMHYLTQVKTELVVKMMLLHDDTNKTRIELTAINAEIYIREKEIKEWNKALRNIDELLPGSPEQ